MPNTLPKQDSIYLPGLNGLRAIAAMVVMVFHTDQWSEYFGLTPYGFWNTRMQAYAVVLFFVLSGFLITYLLLKEKEKKGSINFRKFYIRRILRIWPVYYLVLITGVIILATMGDKIHLPAGFDLKTTAGLYAILVPNIAFFLGYSPDLIGILWSVGVEEQFYAFWPFLVNRSAVLIRTLIILLFIFCGIKIAAAMGMLSFTGIDVLALMSYIPFHLMAIGAIAADTYYHKRKILALIYHPILQVIAWLFLLVSIFWAPVQVPFIKGFQQEIHAFVYAVIILNVSTNPGTLVDLENKVCNFLGKISYGIYAYHFIILFLVSLALKPVLPSLPSAIGHGLMFVTEALVTILVAHLSYTYYESWFLRQKSKYLVIKSSSTNPAG
ncbi:MAG: hypothetical protein DI535_16355 [Citrobacter freundii]|nr:MAG: hypothetical protein DI535_16355 [Citrobacter freundii]